MLYLLDDTCPYCGSMDDQALGGIDWELVQWDWKGETVQECDCCGKRFIIHVPAAAEAEEKAAH